MGHPVGGGSEDSWRHSDEAALHSRVPPSVSEKGARGGACGTGKREPISGCPWARAGRPGRAVGDLSLQILNAGDPRGSP